MRIVFLDIDGVLNCMSTKERYHGFIGVDDTLLENFAEFMRESNEEEETKIVLSSSWRIGQDRTGADIPGGYEYLQRKLAEHGLYIYDETPRLKWGDESYKKRGREIAAWLYLNRDKDISGYVVFDDVIFGDFKKYKISDHLVQTSLANDGGFHKNHGKKALRILRLPVTIDADVDPNDVFIMKKKSKQEITAGYTRPCREVICPFCDHRFMWLGSLVSQQPTYYYINKETNEGAYDTICPRCGEAIILEPHVLLGAAPCEDKYDKIGLRGI